jgi:hypothetical protein
LYEQEVLDSSKTELLNVLGRVVWYGRKMWHISTKWSAKHAIFCLFFLI